MYSDLCNHLDLCLQALHQSLCGVVIDNDKIVNKFVFYYLKTRYDDLRRISSGEGTRGGLNLKMIGAYPIPIPSYSEQTRIVGILDTFTASIENLKQQIAERRKQYEHYRNQLLDLEGKEGVEMRTLPEISKNCDKERKPITSSKRDPVRSIISSSSRKPCREVIRWNCAPPHRRVPTR